MIFNDFLLFQVFTITLINSVTPVVAIIGGRPAEDYPFFVLVPKSEQNCGGTIIAPDIVLTAAQCLYYEQQQRWALNEEVHVLHGNFSVPGAWFAKYHQGQSYLVHELYRPNNARVKNPFDIALIKVEDSFHITLSTRGNKPMLTTCYMGHSTNKYGYGTMIGLGLVSQSPLTKAARLMETQLMKDNLCNGMYGSRRGKEAMQLCYGDPGIGRSTNICDGDAGGPIVHMKKGRVDCVIGVASFGAKICNDSYESSVFTTAGFFHEWILRKISTFNQHSIRDLKQYQMSFLVKTPWQW